MKIFPHWHRKFSFLWGSDFFLQQEISHKKSTTATFPRFFSPFDLSNSVYQSELNPLPAKKCCQIFCLKCSSWKNKTLHEKIFCFLASLRRFLMFCVFLFFDSVHLFVDKSEIFWLSTKILVRQIQYSWNFKKKSQTVFEIFTKN